MVPTKGERQADSKIAFKAHPKLLKVRRGFADIRGQRTVLWGEGYVFSDPYWRVSIFYGDWQERNRHEIKRGSRLATASATTGCSRDGSSWEYNGDWKELNRREL